MIVTSDAGSVYDPSPSLSCTWDAGSTAPTSDSIESITSQLEGLTFEQAKTGGGGEMSARSEGERIFVYHGPQVHAFPPPSLSPPHSSTDKFICSFLGFCLN